ncbi:MAG: tetratricopeptide repeat protein [Nitrospirae bacterium]|nr:tetratricopeptide repeat protein [Nitrospirota bacterium]
MIIVDIEKKLEDRYIKEYKYLHKIEERLLFFIGLRDEARSNNLKKYELFFEGYIAFLEKNWDKAVEKYDESIKIDNHFSHPVFGLGFLYTELKQNEKAKEYFEQAVKLDEKYPRSWNGLGNVCRKLKQYEEAINHYKRAIELDSSYSSPLNGLGNVYYELKQFEKAQENYEKAIKLDNKNSHPVNGLGNVYFRLSQYEEAIKHYEQAIELDNKNSHARYGLGNVYYELGQYKKAKEYYKKAMEIAIEQKDKYIESIAQSNLDFIEEKLKVTVIDHLDIDASEIDDILNKTAAFEDEIYKNKKSFLDFLKEVPKEGRESTEDSYFQVLRRWNSYTPIIADNYHVSKGGGYFLQVNGKGIVIDPGFNFIENFIGAGHKFGEIDYVFVSHAHNDHTSDIESIITLLHKYNKRLKGIDDFTSEDTLRAEIARGRNCSISNVSKKDIDNLFKERRKVINFYITKSVFKKYGGMFELKSSTDFNIHIVESGNSNVIDNIKFRVIKAKHFDIISDRDSVGFVFEINDEVLIYTGDTGWNGEIETEYEEIAKHYEGKRKLLVAHLGGFKEDERQTFYDNHLGRCGLARLIQVLEPEICFISEFGEEMGRYRPQIADIFKNVFNTTLFLPADIGLKYSFSHKKIWAITNIDTYRLVLNQSKYGYVAPEDVGVVELIINSSLHYYEKNGFFTVEVLVQVLNSDYMQKAR